jgi:pilus assembly protein Flp/PilA
MEKIQNFFKNDSGATIVEYGLLVTFIAIAVIVGITAVGSNLEAVFDGVAPKIKAPS